MCQMFIHKLHYQNRSMNKQTNKSTHLSSTTENTERTIYYGRIPILQYEDNVAMKMIYRRK